MSSFFGIWRRDGKELDKKEAKDFAEGFAWWKPDAFDYILEKDLLVGQATLYNTPESFHEHPPLRRDGLILVADARIDNREALAKELELPGRPVERIGDGEFILAAYEKWGEACVDKLVGDFAFVIWDEKKQELFCARDFIGVRPFYYYTDESYFIFGSDIKALAAHPHIPKKIRDKSIATFIANGQLTDRKHTFFEDICKLEDGCIMTIKRHDRQIERYWDPRKIEPLELPNEEAYISRLRELLHQAVKDRLRTAFSVAAHLSGGLDSSPVSVLAARALKAKGYALPVYSWQPEPQEGDDLDRFEWRYARIVAEAEGMELHFSKLDSRRIVREIESKNLMLEGNSMFWYEAEIREDLVRRGVRTMLSGWGGDEFVTNHAYAFYCEMFLTGQWGTMMRAMREKFSVHGGGFKALLKHLYLKIFVPLMPDAWYCKLPKIRCKKRDFTYVGEKLYPLVLEALKAKNHIFARDTSRFVRDDIYRAYENGHVQSRLNEWAQESKAYRYEYTYPLLDRRLVEFSLAVPSRYMIGKGFDRLLYRKAIKDILPEEIIWGIHKSEPIRWKKIEQILEEVNEQISESEVIRKNLEKYDFDLEKLKQCDVSARHIALLSIRAE